MNFAILIKLLLALMFLLMSSSALATDIPDANSADAQVYASRCSLCHDLPHPKRLDWQGWRNMLYLMERRMDERKVEKPSAEEWQAIARYVKSHAQ